MVNDLLTSAGILQVQIRENDMLAFVIALVGSILVYGESIKPW